MRNVFDQYQQVENQLSHALATVLSQEEALCRRFAEWLLGSSVGKNIKLGVAQQRIPGDALEAAALPDQKGLPDICIHASNEWCLAIESKVGSSLTRDQLARHESSVKRCFLTVYIAAITAQEKPAGIPNEIPHRTWAGVYCWMGEQEERESWWVRQLRDFMRLLEARLLTEKKHIPAPITMFDGIPFGSDHPYNYQEAKLLIRQVIPILRSSTFLGRLGVDPSCGGRSAITGKDSTRVWDFISLRPAGHGDDDFTEWPHLTLGIHSDLTEAMITMPNSVNTGCRKAFRELGTDGFQELAAQISNNLLKEFGASPGYKPVMRIVHRHYPSQRSEAVMDGEMEVDLRTAVKGGRDSVKAQPHWFAAAYHLLSDKKGCNLQLQMGVNFLHSSKMIRGADAVGILERGYGACSPLIEALMKRSTGNRAR